MDRKWLIGIGVGLLAAASLVAVGAGAYELGQRDDDRVLVTSSETIDGRIIVDNDGWRHGPGGLVFPLLIAGVIFLVISSRRRRGYCGPGPGWDRQDDGHYRHGWHGPGPYGPGPYGSAPYGAPQPGTSQPTGPVPTSDRDPAPPEGSGEG